MTTIYDLINQEKTAYQKPVTLADGWDWSMRDHLRRCFLYLNSQFEEENENRTLRPNKNIILGITNVQKRTSGFDVKDIDLYVDDDEEYYKSFLVKKYHDKWALDNQIDTFIDDMVDSYVDYGGVLVRTANNSRPEVIDLRSLAFCNQKNLLAYPFGIEHKLSYEELREMGEELGWGKDTNGATIDIETLISLCKRDDEKEITIYEVHGRLRTDWLTIPDESGDWWKKKDTNQVQIVAFYKQENGNEQGVTLFRKRMPKLPFKFLARDKIIGRALGRSGIEELLEPQKWTNWDEIKVTEMLEAASKVIGWTDDPTLSAKHPSGMQDMDNLEFLELQAGRKAGIMDTYPRNLGLFNDSLERWHSHAQIIGAAGEGLLGETPSSGMPFKLYEAKNIEDKSMHRFRQGKIAVFMDEIYRDWILPHFQKEISKDITFLAELSSDEMMSVVEQVMTNAVSDKMNETVLSGKVFDPAQTETIKQQVNADFMKTNKKFIKIFKDEMKKPLGVMTNIAGKQKNLALLTDKIVALVRQFLATPQLRQDPGMVKLLNVIIESSGLSPIMFGAAPAMPPQQQQNEGTESLKQLAQPQMANQMV